MERHTSRREFLRAAGGAAAGLGLGGGRSRSSPRARRPRRCRRPSARWWARRGSTPGKVKLELPPLSENGNAVPLTVSVESPMTEADHVKAIHVFTEKNPQPDVVSVRLGPRAGRARVATRIRLADTQTVVAICELSDGSFWSDRADVVVTLAACLEEL